MRRCYHRLGLRPVGSVPLGLLRELLSGCELAKEAQVARTEQAFPSWSEANEDCGVPLQSAVDSLRGAVSHPRSRPFRTRERLVHARQPWSSDKHCLQLLSQAFWGIWTRTLTCGWSDRMKVLRRSPYSSRHRLSKGDLHFSPRPDDPVFAQRGPDTPASFCDEPQGNCDC